MTFSNCAKLVHKYDFNCTQLKKNDPNLNITVLATFMYCHLINHFAVILEVSFRFGTLFNSVENQNSSLTTEMVCQIV